MRGALEVDTSSAGQITLEFVNGKAFWKTGQYQIRGPVGTCLWVAPFCNREAFVSRL